MVCYFQDNNRDRKEFFNRYSETVYSRFKFRTYESKFEEVLEKISGTKNLFVELDRTNNALLGKGDAENITKVVAEILIVDIKEKISSALMNINKRNKPEDIAFIVALSSFFVAPQNKFEPVFKHLADLKEECFKLSTNLFATLYEAIGFTTAPNKFCDAEPFVIQAGTILKAISKDRSFGRELLKRCTLVSSDTVDGLNCELGSKCYQKIEDVLKKITGVRRSIFLINNLYVLKDFLKEHNKKRLSDWIAESQVEVVEVWQRECSRRRGTDITSFLDTNIEVQKRYILPADIRESLVEMLSGMIKDVLEGSKYTGSKEKLLDNLSQLFTGK